MGKVGIIARLKEHGALKAKIPRTFNIEGIETSGSTRGIYTYESNQWGEIHARLRNARQALETLRKIFAIAALKI